jgi:2-polyprenyl-3-methyl-5-hydroxy-6-metoxy-1,4-benzoquinol methylase
MLTEHIQPYLDSHFEYLGHLVQVEMTPEQHAGLFQRIQAQWTAYGASEPYASVLSSKEFQMDNIANSLALLIASGQHMIARMQRLLARNNVALPRGVCLELGCGVGRLTQPLAGCFEKVVAVDISPGNLAICRDHLRQAGTQNVETLLLQDPHAIRQIRSIDAFVSLIVLQHNPPPIQHYLLEEIFRKVNPGGLCYFQTATYNPDYFYTVDAHMGLDDAAFNAWSMHCLPMARILALLRKYDFEVLEVIEDGQSGGIHNKFHSHTFLAKRA